MEAPTVPKIKAFLAAIKAQYLDDENVASDAQRTFHALVKMELLLRGVLVHDENKLWQQVLSSAGKALMTEAILPNPLLSGANVLAGRVAEVCFSNRLSFKPNLSATSSALRRAQELKDQRLIILLQQDFDPLEVAKGYFIRAAHANPDKPPMFKKVWDILIEQYNDAAPFEAHYAIENLIRIASSKGNAKRSAELRLKLIQSFLNKDIGGRDNSVSNQFAGSQTMKRPEDVHNLMELAKRNLNECEASLLSDSDRISLKVLSLRVEMALENAKVERLAQVQYQADKNRSKPASMKLIRSNCRKQVFEEQLEDPVQELSFQVRDVLLQLWSSSGGVIDIDCQLVPCLDAAQKALLRLHDRAQVLGGDDVWVVLLHFMRGLIEGLKTLSSWNQEIPRFTRVEEMVSFFRTRTTKERELVSTIATVFPASYWVLLRSGINPMDEILYLLLDTYSVLQQCDPDADKKKSNVIESESTVSDKKLQWKCARSIVMCYLCQDDPEFIFQITTDAVSRKLSGASSPLGLLQCLVSWSGWFQSPWPHCSNISDARRLLARAKVDSGRSLTVLEEVLLNLAHADAELLQGGFVEDAEIFYVKAKQVVEKDTSLEDGTKALLIAHCCNGLARACRDAIEAPSQGAIEGHAQEAIDNLQKAHSLSRLHIWHVPSVLSASAPYQLSLARQLVADSLMGEGRSEEASFFLEAAVKDSPLDATAAFSFGAFLLRMAFYENKERSEGADKMAQVQLLKAAKLNPSMAKPFGLLGFWFEDGGDLPRAKGCYLKSLTLDPCDPVAGRGILRLETYENSKKFLDAAIDRNSSSNGWAWHAVGMHKVLVEGEDDFALVAFLKALRCRDITQTTNEPLGNFYHQKRGTVNERATVLEETGQCYRRLGRYTAAIRAFHASVDAYQGDKQAPSSVLCSCAQVELELGLFEDAVENFSKVLDHHVGSSIHPIAAYGQGIALLSIAQQELQDGKFGSAFSNVQIAIKGCIELANDFSCIYKLLGDLYSFGASVPLSVFEGDVDKEEGMLSNCMKEKLAFVARGEQAYRSALRLHETTKRDDSHSIARASFLCDVACNVLLQANIMSLRFEAEGKYQDSDEMYERAAKEFENVIACNPVHASAWCGLGCAVKDPLLAQHAFCRCLQLERMLPDGYANLGFLYTELEAYNASDETMNALTQVADTPMMWINRGLMLERQAVVELGGELSSGISRKMTNAADAYRAALQVMKQPDAMIGLAVTGRVIAEDEKYRPSSDSTSRKDSSALLKEFLAVSSHFQKEASLLSSVLQIEQATAEETNGFEWYAEVLENGRRTVNRILSDKDPAISLDTSTIEACLQDYEEQVPAKEETENFDSQEAIQRQILHDPKRPDLWLLLAKQVVCTLTPSSPPQAISAAFKGATRACCMFTQSLTSPHHIDQAGVDVFVRSEMVCEALALVHHLESLQIHQDNSGISNYDLQRALIMGPGNPLARAALTGATI